MLNFGVPDLTGKDTSRHAVLDRAAQLQAAVVAFEPRIDPRTLLVEADAADSRDNAVTFRSTGRTPPPSMPGRSSSSPTSSSNRRGKRAGLRR